MFSLTPSISPVQVSQQLPPNPSQTGGLASPPPTASFSASEEHHNNRGPHQLQDVSALSPPFALCLLEFQRIVLAIPERTCLQEQPSSYPKHHTGQTACCQCPPNPANPKS